MEKLATAVEDLGESLRSVCREFAMAIRMSEPVKKPPREPALTPKAPKPVKVKARGRQLMTVKQSAQAHTAFTESSLRWLIFKGE